MRDQGVAAEGGYICQGGWREPGGHCGGQCGGWWVGEVDKIEALFPRFFIRYITRTAANPSLCAAHGFVECFGSCRRRVDAFWGGCGLGYPQPIFD